MISPTNVFSRMSTTNLGAVLIQVGACQSAYRFLEGDGRGGFLISGLDEGFSRKGLCRNVVGEMESLQ
jgi:hypothetical protein